MHLTTDGVYLANSLATHTVIRPLQMPLWIDLTSVVIAALAGAAVAVEERLDLVGGILLAVIMGLGGGIIRDLLLGLRPVAVTNHYYLPTVTVAALAGYLFASLLRRFGTPFIVLDAMATSLFTVAGVEKALLYDLPYVSAIFIGVAAGVGGGLFVDLVAGHPVGVVRRGPRNATPARFPDHGTVLHSCLTWADHVAWSARIQAVSLAGVPSADRLAVMMRLV
jgi:uncharacterized membrane protein YeiH